MHGGRALDCAIRRGSRHGHLTRVILKIAGPETEGSKYGDH